MPSPATPHRTAARAGNGKSATPTSSKPAEGGLPLGVHDTNSVRDRVRKWQSQGGGVVSTSKSGYGDNEENATPEPTTPKSPTKVKREPSTVTSCETRSQTPSQSSSAPRKRLVSDEHWKLNRTSTAARTPPPAKPSTPSRIGGYTTNDSLSSVRSEKKDVGTAERPIPRATQHGWVRRRKSTVTQDTIDEEKAHDEASSMMTRSAPATKSLPEAGSEWTGNNEKTSPENDAEWAASEADFSELSRRREQGGPPVKAPALRKPPKGGIFAHMLDESRRMFMKPEPEPPRPGQNRGMKIENWLSGTPDPFLDKMEEDVGIPQPLKTRSRQGKPYGKRDDGKECAELDSTPETGRRTSRRKSRGKDSGSSPEHESHRPPKDMASMDRGRERISTDAKEAYDKRRSKSSSRRSERERRALERKELSEPDGLPFSDGSEVSGDNPPVAVNRKRPFPTTGHHQLSTIASVETLRTQDNKVEEKRGPASEPGSSRDAENGLDSEQRDRFEPESLPSVTSQLQRRLTTHDDLISVLSAPNKPSRSIRSARSIRTNRSRLASATVPDLLKELSGDEAKYMRELKTLVGGVIPVLLTCVLSKSDSAIAAGLFRPSADPKDEVNFSKPIVDMGNALERLKAMHKRIPQNDTETLLNWAQGAQRVYRDYLKAWRLGFRDVVVNLAPLEQRESGRDAETKSLDEGLERDENGDVVDGEGEKVDVAYLLKRPLVRLKYLAKTFKGINILQPSTKAKESAAAYHALVTEARRRSREERARLEDESAASIDSTCARDPMTLGVLPGVTVDQTRRVRARDFFNLSLYHSSGQVIDCRAELLLRDNAPHDGPGSDLLICELDHSDRWLLFPPIDLKYVSARKGDSKDEIVVMLRSPPGQGHPWQELLFLQIDEKEVGSEWLQMLGLDPVPPTISRTQSFLDRAKQRQRMQSVASDDDVSQAPSPRTVDVPIGEKAGMRAGRRSLSPKEESSELSAAESSSAVDSKTSTAITRESDYGMGRNRSPDKSSPQPGILHSRTVGGDDKTPPSLKRAKAKRIARGDRASPDPTPPRSPTPDAKERRPTTPPPQRYYGGANVEKTPGTTRNKKSPREKQSPKTPVDDGRRSARLSNVPSMDLPNIPKLRSGRSQDYIPDSLEAASDDEEYTLTAIDDTMAKRRSRSKSEPSEADLESDEPPPPPPHRSQNPTAPLSPSKPTLSPTAARQRRRGSSPLKHEYEPSTASDYNSDSDTSTVRHYEMSSGSDTSGTDTTDESEDELSVLQPVDTKEPSKPVDNASTLPSSATSTLSPSNSASQGGYRSVPAQPSKSSKTVASVFAWSNKGSWDSLFPDDCEIVVSPGLIEAFGMSSNRSTSNSASRGKRPLIALELTPLVPIRRGTAIDISIRSPPTKRSKHTSSNNIMFRSRNPEDCETLYGFINQARINNPTYIALQNARGPFVDQPVPFEHTNKKGGLFGWPRRRKSYRASDVPRSMADHSESSVGTMSSAFSALKRFGGAGNKMFSIARSTVTSRSGHGDDSLNSSSAASGSKTKHSPSSGLGRIAAAIKGVNGIGLSNAKIRLYVRETQSKWRDMGAARLTIMPATPSHSRPATSRSEESGSTSPPPPESGHTSPRLPGTAAAAAADPDAEKRILIRGKTRSEVLLDVCLGESSFERVARTGIAVSVWEENKGGAVAQTGGVTSGLFKVYMIQMKTEAEAAYTFGLVGKLRY